MNNNRDLNIKSMRIKPGSEDLHQLNSSMYKNEGRGRGEGDGDETSTMLKGKRKESKIRIEK